MRIKIDKEIRCNGLICGILVGIMFAGGVYLAILFLCFISKYVSGGV